jgi:hypothetical protein
MSFILFAETFHFYRPFKDFLYHPIYVITPTVVKYKETLTKTVGLC